jgi:cell division protein ZapB
MRTSEQNLRNLEYRIEELIQLCQHLQDENSALRSQQATLRRERARLMEKNEMAQTRVEAMIMRLKSMEHDA